MQQILKELFDAEMGQLIILHLLSCTGQLMELSDVEYSILRSRTLVLHLMEADRKI